MDQKRHFEESTYIEASPRELFAFVDDHGNFASHMNSSSWMMGGGQMSTILDEGKGQQIGSHIRMNGRILGMNLYLDEVVTKYEPPYSKTWKTIGDLNLLIIGNYQMGLKIEETGNKSKLSVFIDYELPSGVWTRWLGYLLSGTYSRWCVRQMLRTSENHFSHQSK